ncbi:MAG TPA: pyridoxal-dependent decarboxylase [Pyrinomonadaceae bacterium]|nr:pyridoxal-dependent decarboxylase [Pyrinomonadaceae bacterium]
MSREADREGAPGGRVRETSRVRDASLELDTGESEALAARAFALAAEYFARAPERRVFPETSARDLTRRFRTPVPAEPAPLEELFDDCRAVFDASRNHFSPRMFGYVASPAAPAGAYAALLAAALNQNVTAWRSAPAATEIEHTVVRWLAELICYAGASVDDGESDAARECGGLLTSGGSMANLVALHVAHRFTSGRARELSNRGLRDEDAPAALYVSDQVHLSIPKAADLLGLGREQVRVVASDENFRMDVRALGALIEDDRRAGLRPFCVVASAGTVATGAVDALADVARVARDAGLWFHVDGAYGALAALDERKRPLFAGIGLADSVSLDPHKWLYAPLDCGCLILRDPARARLAFGASEGDYIKVYEREEAEAFAFWDYGMELSRPFRAFKVWMMLRYYGARRVARCVAEDNALAAYMGELVEASEGFELLAPVNLSICCFRCVPLDARRALEQTIDDDERETINARLDRFNERLMHKIQRGGEAYLSNASLRGRFALRACVTNFRTTRADIRATLDAVRRAAEEVDPW